MTDLIRRDAAIGALEERRDQYLQDSTTWLQIQLDIRAIAAMPSVTVGVAAERVKHVKRGSTYRVIGHAHVQTDRPLSDYATVVVYQGESDGLFWCRPLEEFEDGRFAALEPVAATLAKEEQK